MAGAQAFLRLGGERQCRDATLKAAWDEFFQLADACLRGMVTAQKLPPDQREDVAQAVRVKLLKNLHRLQGPGAADQLQRWLSKVVRNEAASVMRRLHRQRAQSLQDLSPETLAPALGKRVDPEEVREVLAALQAENPTSYRLIVGRYLEGRPVRELADEAGPTPAAAPCRIYRAMGTLRRHLVEKREGGQ